MLHREPPPVLPTDPAGDADVPAAVTLLRGRMPRRCRIVRAFGVALLVLHLISAANGVAALCMTSFGGGLFGGMPAMVLRMSNLALSSLSSIAFGLFIFAFTRLIARIGHGAAVAGNVDLAKGIE